MNKISILIIFAFTQCILGWAQGSARAMDSDKAILSVHYIAHFKLYSEAVNEVTEERVLDVGEQTSCFYGRWQRRREEIEDSIVRAGGTMDNILAKITQYPTPRQFYSIYNNCPSAGKRLVTDKLIKTFHYEEDIDDIQWSLLDKDTIILGYHCMLAECKYRNHGWTVYYTDDIPVALGPWKLHGLPGLILYATDDSGIFCFECIDIRNAPKEMAEPRLRQSIRCSREDIKNMQREAFRSPDEFVKRFGAVGKGTDAKGRPIVYPKRTAVFMD